MDTQPGKPRVLIFRLEIFSKLFLGVLTMSSKT